MQALTTTIRLKDAQGRVVEEKEVATYAGVLARAHEEGLSSVTTEIVQIPGPDNGFVAIVSATVTTTKGTFSGIGDAHEGNVGRKIIPHILRMAETRAKVRALRDAVNIGTVSLEELGSLSDDDAGAIQPAPAPTSARRDNVRPLPARRPAPVPERQPAQAQRQPDRQPDRRPPEAANRPLEMSENQRRLLFRMLAEQGFEGDEATNALLHAAEVTDIRHITREDASALIDQWKADQRAAHG